MEELIVEAKIENLHKVQDFIANELKDAPCTVKMQNQIALAAEEIFVNIALYAYGGGMQENGSRIGDSLREAGTAVIRVRVGDKILLEFEDRGRPFNPLEADDPVIAEDVDDQDSGGFGVFIVKKVTDEIKYRYEDNKNILQLIINKSA